MGISKDEGEVGLAADHPDGELGALVVGAHLAGLLYIICIKHETSLSP